MEYERNLMTIEEFCKYVGIGKTKAREKRFELLDSKKELTDDDKREIEITNRFYELLLKDWLNHIKNIEVVEV